MLIIVLFWFLQMLNKEPPFVIAKKNKDGTFQFEGYCVDLINELAKILKFKYEFYPSPDGKYGARMEDATWDGMVREILDGVCTD